MIKKYRLFLNVKSAESWLNSRSNFRLVYTNGVIFSFEESSISYNYEYVYFENGKNELTSIKEQIKDKDIELVCSNSSWALFRKDVSKGDIHIVSDEEKKKRYEKKGSTYLSLGALYICIGASQITLASFLNDFFFLTSIICYVCGIALLAEGIFFRRYAKSIL